MTSAEAWGVRTYSEMIAVLTLSALVVSLRSDRQHRKLGLALHLLCELVPIHQGHSLVQGTAATLCPRRAST